MDDAVSTDELGAALTEYLIPGPIDAATRLLVAHGRWIRGTELRDCIEWADAETDAPAGAWIDWPAVDQKLADGLPGSGSEIAVLEIAVSVADGPIGGAATSCDDRNWALVVAAVQAAREGRS